MHFSSILLVSDCIANKYIAISFINRCYTCDLVRWICLTDDVCIRNRPDQMINFIQNDFDTSFTFCICHWFVLCKHITKSKERGAWIYFDFVRLGYTHSSTDWKRARDEYMIRILFKSRIVILNGKHITVWVWKLAIVAESINHSEWLWICLVLMFAPLKTMCHIMLHGLSVSKDVLSRTLTYRRLLNPRSTIIF